MASYPTSVVVFSTHANITEIIDASHPNNIQDEVTAIEATLGVEPRLSTTPSSSGTFTSTATTFATVNARLANIETGVVADTHTQYLRKAGDNANIITANTGTIKPLVLRGASGQSVNLQEWQNNTPTTIASVDQSGSVTAASFIKTSGTSSQFLKADGSSDSSPYYTFAVNATAKTANYTLLTSDVNTMVQMNGAFQFSVTTGLSSLTAGSQIHLLALTSGVTVVGTGVTLNGTPGTNLRTAYSSATLICLGTNVWVIVGDLKV
jgi:hypothetical protein